MFKSRKRRNKAISRVQVWIVLKNVFKKIKVAGKVATHLMRKTFAQLLGGKTNGNIFLIQKAQGHSRPAVAQQYLSNLKLAILRHQEKTGMGQGKIGIQAGILESRLSLIVREAKEATDEEK